MLTLEVGIRIYNRGDMANPDHYGTVVAVVTDKWGTRYQIRPDADSCERDAYWINKELVSETDTGNGLSRIVTEKEHERFRQERIAAMADRMKAGAR
jgi:hypothetical protein